MSPTVTSSATLDALAKSPAASSHPFVTPEAVHLHDVWSTSAYSGLCFEERRRWLLLVQDRPGLPGAAAFGSAGFSRFPLQVQTVTDRALALKQRAASCWRPGTTFVADLRHGGGATMGIAHFAKRVLRLHGLQRRAAEYRLPEVARFAFPATPAAHLRHSWPMHMLRIVAPSASVASVEALTATDCCYETVVVSAKENTYFVRPEDADNLRAAAHAAAGLPAQR